MPHKNEDDRKRYVEAWREKNREHLKKQAHKNYLKRRPGVLRELRALWKTSPKFRAAKSIAAKKRWASDAELRRRTRSSNMLRGFGITVDEFEAMLIAQGGRCAICARPMDHQKEPMIDHCHATQRVRGLLCISCNFGLGRFRDNPEFLRNAVRYLTK